MACFFRAPCRPDLPYHSRVLDRPLGIPGGTTGKKPTCQCRRLKRHGFNPWVGKIPWRRTWQPTPVFLPRESHGQRSLAGYSPCGRRVRHTEQVSTVQQVSQLIWLCSPQPTAPKPVLSLCHPPLPHLPNLVLLMQGGIDSSAQITLG